MDFVFSYHTKNHNHLERRDNHTMNRAKEGGSGKEHMYHVLKKPGDDDYEDPDKDLEENTAIDYETPVPLKEIWFNMQAWLKLVSYSINNNM